MAVLGAAAVSYERGTRVVENGGERSREAGKEGSRWGARTGAAQGGAFSYERGTPVEGGEMYRCGLGGCVFL